MVGRELTLAVPACAFAVYFFKKFLIRLGSPLKCVAQFTFLNLVVVVDEFCGLLYSESVVILGTQLVGMPSQIYI